ncbi:ATP-binding protein [Herbaspirillum sp. WGmk3]|uniref:ATP-binding protein n=1 Tax=unclassified Herbaspirillum TaxID=2624150 RepID=UPI001956656F|nr:MULTISPECIES: ATP-binding protein [unclassified Herbaspirillum]MBP1318217.1 two-component system sensor histidine kinase AdeS [Herbaspirillum sp. 1130]MCO4859634.1 ATP-binding protein [Herbaspirillum sp. WGmk3]MDR6742690.1 two-component system sensor histidine kinase AdeS [Herbaspirillum sp. 1173]
MKPGIDLLTLWRGKGLARQIISSVAILALTIMLMVLLGSYAFYSTLFIFLPTALSAPDSWLPSPAEWGWIFVTTLIGVAIAVWVAIRLSRRILTPLNSVATSLRRVAQGDLAARAAADRQPLDEASQLISDFNAMAERLERVQQERIFWNAAIAHELRTPVTILRGRLQGLADGVFQPDPALFSSLLVQVEGLGRLIEDLRIVGLAESGHLRIQLQQADLRQEIMTVLKACESALHDKGFTLTLALGAERPACDPVRIRQALLALLENALQHATPGPLRISTLVVDGQHCLRVEDSGPGLSASDAQRIFDAFQRGPRTGDTAAKGSGLGLAVVRAIASAHGGTVDCQPSTLGGACFELRWPK